MKQRLYWPWITALILWSVAPMYLQLLTSFTTSDALVSSGRPWSERWTLIHYKELLQGDPPFWRYLFNSTLVAGGTTLIITLCLAIPGAYGLSKLPRLRRSLRMLIAAAALFPYVLLFLALLELARQLGWGTTSLLITIPYAALSMPLALLLLTAAFEGPPKDLDDAARLEGMSIQQRLRWILIPLITPSLASTAVLVFLFAWNEYPIAPTWISRSDLLYAARRHGTNRRIIDLCHSLWRLCGRHCSRFHSTADAVFLPKTDRFWTDPGGHQRMMLELKSIDDASARTGFSRTSTLRSAKGNASLCSVPVAAGKAPRYDSLPASINPIRER